MLFAMAEHLELPRPWRLMLTAGWNLAESLGIPVVAYFAGASFRGRERGGDDRARPYSRFSLLSVLDR